MRSETTGTFDPAKRMKPVVAPARDNRSWRPASEIAAEQLSRHTVRTESTAKLRCVILTVHFPWIQRPTKIAAREAV